MAKELYDNFDYVKDIFNEANDILNFSISDIIFDGPKEQLDLTFANENEIMTLINTKNFNDVITFAKEIKKHIVITRGNKGAISIFGDKIVEVNAYKNLSIKDLTGAGDLFAAGYLHGFVNELSTEQCLEKGTELSSKVIQQIGARL